MNREEARLYITRNATRYLTPDKSRKGFICPLCKSGSGDNGTGITSRDDNMHFTCWGKGHCFMNADIIDIIGKKFGIPDEDYNSKLQKAASEYGITIDGGYTPTAAENRKQDKTEQNTQSELHNTQDAQKEEPDYTEFFLQANKDIGKTDYHRGITPETLNRFKVGYVEKWRHPKAAEYVTPSPRLIIPTSKHSYLARDTRSELTEEQKPYAKMKVGTMRIFNSEALYSSQKPVFVVEGELDALSIIDVGGEAVALGSTSNGKKLLKMVKDRKPSQPLIIAMDKDTAGENERKELITGLEEGGIDYYEADIATTYKDANEALNADRDAFRDAVEEAQNRGAEWQNEELEKLRKEATAYSLQNFILDIANSKKAAFYPTGFTVLDKLLDGGLYAGLYIVGAVSSLGKTTLCLQIADQIAQTGQDVLIFSLEMARNELIAKSISRLTLIGDLEQHQTTVNAKTTRGILTGARYDGYSRTERELIQSSITEYSKYAQHIYITEGVGNVGVKEIREKVIKHVKLTGQTPVVLIDYLQILAPADLRATDKQNTDKAVLELKRISRDYNIPVIGISSFNRDNYTAPVNLASFKESGAIEYSSDVLIGLQYEGMDYQEGEAEKARDKRIREIAKKATEAAKTGKAQKIQVKILKNRNGSKGETVLDFYPMFNYFKQTQEGADNGTGWKQCASNYK